MKVQLNICHSYWNKPKQNTKKRIDFADTESEYADMLCAALSVAFAKRNNCNISLYTDFTGREKYGWLPYDDVIVCLEDHDFAVDFWASGKIIAQEHAPIGSVFVDMDLFIKNQTCVDKILSLKNCDAVAQNFENNYETNCNNKNSVAKVVDILGRTTVADMPEVNFATDIHAYCCGLVQFNNAEYKARYIEGYKKLYAEITSGPNWEKHKNTVGCIDLLTEQAYLYLLKRHYGYSVGTLIGNGNSDWYGGAKEVGLTHLIHISKYHHTVIEKCEQLLKQVDLELYKKVLEFRD